MPSVLSEPHFHNEEAAYAFVEAQLWPDGPTCPHCGATKEHVGKLQGKTTRIGLHKCYACRKPFTVKIGTVFESSHAPLRIWLQAIHLLCSSKKGISTRQLQRTLGVGMKTAWFLGHRIREAMIPTDQGMMGGSNGGHVEADETYIGTSRPKRHGERGADHKRKVVALVERGGQVRSFHVNSVNKNSVHRIISVNVDPATHLMTDESPVYRQAHRWMRAHSTVNHKQEEYVRGEVHTNTVEGVFSVFKRGMIGIYQQCGEQHLQRYLTEFDFRYSNRVKLGVDDMERTNRAITGAKGKRLTYRTTRGGRASQTQAH